MKNGEDHEPSAPCGGSFGGRVGRDACPQSAQAPAACMPADSAAHRKRPHTSPTSARSNGDVLGMLAPNRPTESNDSERAGDDPKDVSAAPQTKALKMEGSESAGTQADEPYLQQVVMSYDTKPDVALHGLDVQEATMTSMDTGENGLRSTPAEEDGSENPSLAARPTRLCVRSTDDQPGTSRAARPTRLCVRSPSVEPSSSAFVYPSPAGVATLPMDLDGTAQVSG